MTITVSTTPSTPTLTYKQRLRRNVDASFDAIGYRFGTQGGKFTAVPSYDRLPSLKFDDLHFAKAWLVRAGAWKEVA